MDILRSNSMRLSAAILLLAALAAGCANVQWRKEGADQAALEQDLAQCRQEARQRADREAWTAGLPATRTIGVNPQGAPIAAYSYSFENERFVLEHEFTRSCMRDRGYRLAPAEGLETRKSGPVKGGDLPQALP